MPGSVASPKRAAASTSPPNLLVQNRGNGRGHLFYALTTPVGMSASHRSAPIQLCQAIQRGMTRRLQADPLYANRLAKNPLHRDWRASWIAPQPYDPLTLLEPLDPADTRAAELFGGRRGKGGNVAPKYRNPKEPFPDVDRARSPPQLDG